MIKHTLIFICSDVLEASKAHTSLQRIKDQTRFFIFIGEKPKETEFLWIPSEDSILCLENIIEKEDHLKIVVRAGLIYSKTWDFLFIWAKYPPTEFQYSEALNNLEKNNIVKVEDTGGKIWGASREFVVLNDIISIYPSSNPNKNEIIDKNIEYDLYQAMQGKESKNDIIILGLLEILPINNIFISNMDNISEPIKSFISSILLKIPLSMNDIPSIILLTDLNNQEDLDNSINRTSFIIITTKDEKRWKYNNVIKKFKSTEGFYVIVIKC